MNFKLNIVIADCNHGFFKPEKEEGLRLGVSVDYIKCSQDDLVEKCKDADVIIVQRLKITGEIIDRLPKCKVVTRYGVGLDNIDCVALAKRRIGVVNFPGFCTVEVANHAVAAILFFHRRFDVLFSGQITSPSRWGMPVEGVKSANDTVVGILGFGRIGSQVGLRLKSCGFKIHVHDPYINRQHVIAHGIKPVSIDQIFSHSDVVTLHVPLTHETKGLVDKGFLNLMRKESCLINTSRGEIINTHDLIQSTSEGKIRKVFIDVCDPEPPSPAILENSSIYVTPHCAFYSSRSLDFLKRNVIIKSVEKYHDMQSNTSY